MFALHLGLNKWLISKCDWTNAISPVNLRIRVSLCYIKMKFYFELLNALIAHVVFSLSHDIACSITELDCTNVFIYNSTEQMLYPQNI